MPKRSREEKLAAYSAGAKRGYRARKRMLAARGAEMKEAPTGGGGASIFWDVRSTVEAVGAENAGHSESTCKLNQNAQAVNRVLHLFS